MDAAAFAGDGELAHAVDLLDRGEVAALSEWLARHPRLVTARATGDCELTRGYFRGPTLLHFIAQNPTRGDGRIAPHVVDCARAILDRGADVDAHTLAPQGGTTLALVASSHAAHDAGVALGLIELLVARGADPNHGVRAAILHRHPQTTRELIKLGARPSAAALAGIGDLAGLRQLLAVADPNDLVDAGWAAAINGQLATLDAVLDGGLAIDVRLPRPFAPTLLHEAASRGERAVCERLVARGGNVSLRDSEFAGTAADWARHGGHQALAAWLDDQRTM